MTKDDSQENKLIIIKIMCISALITSIENNAALIKGIKEAPQGMQNKRYAIYWQNYSLIISIAPYNKQVTHQWGNAKNSVL